MAAPNPPPQPDFILFLFSEKPKFDCHFLVGDQSLVKPEKIGAVKMMLMAHSVVFRTELEESELKEKGEIPVKDLYPDTFRILLKFIYGHDTTGKLTFDEADNMFYAADKYMMSSLKKKLAVRLITLLTPDNVCTLLNNPAISTQLQLKAHITQILRYETDKVLASPQFLEVCSEATFISILEQDGLAVPEIELWRAALKWAKHRADSDDVQVLRQQLTGISKHLKICTFTAEQFCEEVAPVGVLNRDEVLLVVESIGKKRKIEELTEFNNELEPRKRFHTKMNLIRSQESVLCAEKKLKLIYHNEKCKSSCGWRGESKLAILTKRCAVELLPLVCLALERGRMEPEGWMYKLSGKVHIIKKTNRNSIDDISLTVSFNKEVEYGKTFEVPLTVDGYNVTLHPNSNYSISVCFTQEFTVYKYKNYIYENEHMLLEVPEICFSNHLRYRPVSDELTQQMWFMQGREACLQTSSTNTLWKKSWKMLFQKCW